MILRFDLSIFRIQQLVNLFEHYSAINEVLHVYSTVIKLLLVDLRIIQYEYVDELFLSMLKYSFRFGILNVALVFVFLKVMMNSFDAFVSIQNELFRVLMMVKRSVYVYFNTYFYFLQVRSKFGIFKLHSTHVLKHHHSV